MVRSVNHRTPPVAMLATGNVAIALRPINTDIKMGIWNMRNSKGKDRRLKCTSKHTRNSNGKAMHFETWYIRYIYIYFSTSNFPGIPGGTRKCWIVTGTSCGKGTDFSHKSWIKQSLMLFDNYLILVKTFGSMTYSHNSQITKPKEKWDYTRVRLTTTG